MREELNAASHFSCVYTWHWLDHGEVKIYSCHAWLPKTDELSEMQLFNSEGPALMNIESLDQAPGPGPIQNTSPIS